MAHRNLDVTLISARGIKNVNRISKMDVYAVVSISGGDPRAVIRTPVDKDAGTNPTWNFPMKFTLDQAAVQQNRLTLVVKLRSQRELRDKDIGEVHVPIMKMTEENKEGEQVYEVKKVDGKPQGELHLSYKVSDTITEYQAKEKYMEEHVTAYPAQHAQSGSGYQQPAPATAYPSMGPVPATAGYPSMGGYPPPCGNYPPAGYPPPGAPPVAAGYGYPPQQGGYPPPQQGGYPPQPVYGGYPPQAYGHPPPQQGYGYPRPMQQPPMKNNKIGGMGKRMAVGLLGGAIGGMLFGEMISDAGAYNAGYGAGAYNAGSDSGSDSGSDDAGGEICISGYEDAGGEICIEVDYIDE